MGYTDLMLPTSPVGYWETNDPASATTLTDASGNAHAATLLGSYTLGAPGLIPSETDTALQLTGAGAASVPNLAIVPPFSLSWVMQPTGDGGVNTGYGTGLGYAPNRRVLWADPLNGTKILAQMGAANLTTPVGSVPAGKIAHVAYTNDKVTETLYVNGSAEASQPNAAATWNSAFYIGAYAPVSPPGSYQLAGTIEKIAVHNVCLDPATIASLAAAALNPPPLPPGVTPLVWNGTAWVPTSLQMFVGSQAPAGQDPNDVWVKVT